MVRLEVCRKRKLFNEVSTFQFHNGSIRSRCQPWSPESLYQPFNSTMVRLEDIQDALSSQRYQYFQFHNGSIRSWIDSVALTDKMSFNSTMVRLEGALMHAARTCAKWSFNSTMVRLEAISVAHASRPVTPFNSTMVRLEVGSKRRCYAWRCGLSIPQWFD